MSRLSSNRANAPSAKKASEFKGFRSEWRTDTNAVKVYGERRRKQRRKRAEEAWRKYEEHRASMLDKRVLLPESPTLETPDTVESTPVDQTDAVGVSQSS